MKICRVATVPFFLFHNLGRQIQEIGEQGHQLTLVCSRGPELADLARLSNADIHNIEIPREISLWRDLAALIQLFRLFRKNRFDLVHSNTPKAGLLVAVAAWLARVPIRLHTFTGQVWVTRRGLVRWICKASDRLIVMLNTHCYADSASQRDFLVAEGVANVGQVSVLGHGSLAGVNLMQFNRSLRASASAVKRKLGLPEEARVIGFVGRVTRDKGIVELIDAFEMLPAMGCSDVHLVIVGPLEPHNDPLPEEVLNKISRNQKIRMVGYTSAPEEYMAAFDVFCLPSYREGFPKVVLEAAAMGIPTVGTTIVGMTDAIEKDVTGLMVPVRDAGQLAAALCRLIGDDALCQQMGNAAEARVLAQFDAKVINACVLEEYARLAISR